MSTTATESKRDELDESLREAKIEFNYWKNRITLLHNARVESVGRDWLVCNNFLEATGFPCQWVVKIKDTEMIEILKKEEQSEVHEFISYWKCSGCSALQEIPKEYVDEIRSFKSFSTAD